jgi:GNAT superfamily N-acetyltransferase
MVARLQSTTLGMSDKRRRRAMERRSVVGTAKLHDEMSGSEADSVTRARVTITFLCMLERPQTLAPPLPANAQVIQWRAPKPERYLALQEAVGGEYLWWLRRATPRAELVRILENPQVAVHVLQIDGQDAGYYELDASRWPFINLSYFGLMPNAIGHGLGRAFLRHAVDNAWSGPIRGVTVNTCTADHPRALPLYESVGFRRMKVTQEDWDIPDRLGFKIPDRLRA